MQAQALVTIDYQYSSSGEPYSMIAKIFVWTPIDDIAQEVENLTVHVQSKNRTKLTAHFLAKTPCAFHMLLYGPA